MTIYDSTGTIVYEAPITTSAIIKRVLMGDYYIELVFDAVNRIDVGRGSYILYNGHKFEIMSNVLPEGTNTGGLRYTLRFEAQQAQMKRCKVFWRDSDNLEVSFSNTTSLSSFGALIIQNVNAFLGSDNWSLGDYPTELETTLKTVSFNGDSCWDAVATIAETFGVEWWTEESGEGVRLCFGKLETGTAVEFKKGDIVSAIPNKKGDDANYGTRFYVFGSTKNLPSDYSSTEEGGITNHVVEKRLHLPNGQQYIDAWDNLAQEDVVEQVVFFDDVFPTNVETITSIAFGHEEIIEGEQNLIYHVKCDNSPLTLDDIIEGETIQANFTSGALNGMTFDVEIDTTATEFDKWFKIKPNVIDADSSLIIPNESLAPSVGDTFILIGVELPQGRIDEAEQTLLEVGTEYAKKNSNDTDIYDCPTNAVYCHKNRCNYDLGQRVTLVDQKFGDGGRASRIQGYEKKLYDEYQTTYTVGDNSPYSRFASLEKAIQKSSYGDRVGLEANIIRSKSDSTLPSDYNVYSALATEEYFLSKRRGGTVNGHTDFAKGVSMYGIPWEYDAEKDAWTIKGNVIITRGLAVYSTLKDEDIISVYDGIPIDNQTIQWKEVDGGKVLVVNPDMIGGSGNIDEDAVNELINAALEDYVPTTTTITAGTGLMGGGTLAANRTLSLATVGTAGTYAKVTTDAYGRVTSGTTLSASDIPSLPWSKITSGKPTTLAGYGITDAYTKTEIGNAFVSRTTAQDITAQHNFVNGIKLFGKSPFRYDSANDAWELNGNLVVTGGAAFFTKLEGFEGLDLTSSLNVDGTTISNEGGILKVIGGTGGGLDEDQLAEYLAENGYATQTWVTSQKYLTSHQTIYNLTLKAGAFSATTFDPNGAASSVNIPTTTSHISEGTNLYFTDARARAAVLSSSSVLTASRALISNSSGKVAVSAVTSTELGYLDGVTSAIQDQLDDKLDLAGGTMTGNLTVKTASAMISAHNNEDYIGLHNEYHCGLWYGQGTTTNGSKWILAFNSSRSAGWFTVPVAIGTTGAQASYMLYVNGSSRFAGSLTPETHLSYNIGSSSRAFVRTYTQYLDSPTGYNLRLCSAGTEVLTISTTGKARIGSKNALTDDDPIFCVNGDTYISGQLAHALTSDRRLKRNIRKFSAAKYLRSLGGVFEFEYIDEEVARDKYYRGTHLGFIYQNVKGSRLTGMCIERENGYGALNLLHSDYLALLGAAATEHEDRIHTLERQIKALQKELKQLKSA